MRIEDLPQESYEFNLTFQSKYILQVFRVFQRERLLHLLSRQLSS